MTFDISFQIRLKKEQEEKEDKRRYKAQAHLFTIIKVQASYLPLFNSRELAYVLMFLGSDE